MYRGPQQESCVAIYGNPSAIKSPLHGIDCVHIKILDTFMKDGGLQTLLEDPQVIKGVAEGYLTITVWKDELDSKKQQVKYFRFLLSLES